MARPKNACVLLPCCHGRATQDQQQQQALRYSNWQAATSKRLTIGLLGNKGDRGPRPRDVRGGTRRQPWSPIFRRGPGGGRTRDEPPLTVSEAAASTTISFKDQSRAVDGPEPSTTGVGAARGWRGHGHGRARLARPPLRRVRVKPLGGLCCCASVCVGREAIPHGPKEQAV